MNARVAATVSAVFCALLSGCLAESVGWRTDGTGRYLHADSPTKWSATENVVWKTRLPKSSNASPIVVGDRIFVCADPDKLICVSRADGKILWERTNSYVEVLGPEAAARAEEGRKQAQAVAKRRGPVQREYRHLTAELKRSPGDPTKKKRQQELKSQLDKFDAELAALRKHGIPVTNVTTGYSSSTPTSDGKYVYAVFGSGIVACYDMQGNRKWIKLLEKPTHVRGHSASPILVDGKVIVHIVDLVALDVTTGGELWRAKLGVDRWGSEVRARIGNVDVVITPDGNIVRASDGKILTSKLCLLEASSPVVQDGVAYFIKRDGVAVKLPDAITDKIEPEVLWRTKPKKVQRFASPLVHDGLIYTVTRYGILGVIDAKTGKVVYEKKLDLPRARFYSSVTLGGKYLHISSEKGTTLVLEPGREYKEVAKNQLEKFRSTPVFIGKRMYIRGSKYLYCIGE